MADQVRKAARPATRKVALPGGGTDEAAPPPERPRRPPWWRQGRFWFAVILVETLVALAVSYR